MAWSSGSAGRVAQLGRCAQIGFAAAACTLPTWSPRTPASTGPASASAMVLPMKKDLRRGAACLARIQRRAQHGRDSRSCAAPARAALRAAAANVALASWLMPALGSRRGHHHVEAGRQDRAAAHGSTGSSEVTMVMSCGRGQLAALGAFGEIPVDQLALAVGGGIEHQAIPHDVVVQRLAARCRAGRAARRRRRRCPASWRRSPRLAAMRHRRLYIDRSSCRCITSSGPRPPKAFGNWPAAVVSMTVALQVGQHHRQLVAAQFQDHLAAGAAGGDRAVGVADHGQRREVARLVAVGDGARRRRCARRSCTGRRTRFPRYSRGKRGRPCIRSAAPTLNFEYGV